MPTVSESLQFACSAQLEQVDLLLPGGERHTLPLKPCVADEESEHTVSGRLIILRRVHCTINDHLLRRDNLRWRLHPQTRAALLWRAYQRYDQLDGVRLLSGGMSNSHVLVFRPRLRTPDISSMAPKAALASAGHLDVLGGSWGTPLLVKTGPSEEICREWVRAEVFLRDRQSPFVVRYEEPLEVRPIGTPEELRDAELTQKGPRATAFSSFLGDDVVRAEPLDKLIRGTRDAGVAIRALDAVAGHLATWHRNPREHKLAEWPRAFRFETGAPPADWPQAQPDARWLLFGQYNFRKETANSKAPWDMPQPGKGEESLGRNQFRKGITWDYAFVEKDHLSGHLLGSPAKRNGLLYELAKMPALFSLVHGDLNPRNVLCDASKVWLIDFEKTGVGPVLADLARLEVNLRLWCIRLGPMTDGATDAVRRLEFLLLDNLHGSECSLEPVRSLAHALGADPDELEKIARCVVRVRELARRWCVPQFSDARDYLAVLYLNVLSLIPHAGKGHNGASNERWLVGLFWAIEETLDRILGREPFDRGLRPYDPLHHVAADLVDGPGLARRVNDLCSTTDGRLALAPVEALRGVLQGGYHHLDAYDHTLSVVAYLEAILADPLAALLNPAALDATVTATLAAIGCALTPPDPGQVDPPPPNVPWLAERCAGIRTFVEGALTDDARRALLWCAVLHDVGKPGTRTVKVKADGPEVQFLGHQGYGVALLRDRLLKWFPGPNAAPGADEPNALGRMVKSLILDHHVSHQLMRDLFLEPEKGRLIDDLYAVLTRPHGAKVLKWLDEHANPTDFPCLPLLLLHGHADRLAARGRHWGTTVTEWATATLALLAFLADYQALDAIRHGPGELQTARRDASTRHVTDLLAAGNPRFGAAVGVCMRELADQVGTVDELLAHLCRVIDRVELDRRLSS